MNRSTATTTERISGNSHPEIRRAPREHSSDREIGKTALRKNDTIEKYEISEVEALKALLSQANAKISQLELIVESQNAKINQLEADYKEEKIKVGAEQIAGLLNRKELEQKNKENKELFNEAFFDDITGCYSRKYYEKVIKNPEMTDINIETGNVAMTMLDLNGLKLINDLIGHESGDKLLKISASFVRDALRAGDRVIRYGGDEFVALCFKEPNENLDTFTRGLNNRFTDVADKLKQRLEEEFNLEYPFPPYYFAISAIEDKSIESINSAFSEADSKVSEQKESRPTSREILLKTRKEKEAEFSAA